MPIRLAADGPLRCSRPRLPAVGDFTSPRAWAFTLLGLDAYCAVVGGETSAEPLARNFGRQVDVAASTRRKPRTGVWFEDGLAYDNARLPQALILTGVATQDTGLCRGRPAIAALAHVAADHAVRMFQTGWHRKLRQIAPEARSIRSAARGGSGGDFRLPRGMAR